MQPHVIPGRRPPEFERLVGELILEHGRTNAVDRVFKATGKPPADAEEYATHINRITLIVNFGNGNFNNGLRAYYFGVAALSWFLHPVLLIAVTTAVVYVLHQREYHSRTVQAMIDM